MFPYVRPAGGFLRSQSTKLVDVSLTVAVQTYTISNIPQTADQLFVRIKNPFASNAAFSVRPVGLTTNQSNRFNFHDYTAAAAKLDDALFYWMVEGVGGGVPAQYDGWFSLDIKTGQRRTFEASGQSYDSSGSRLGRSSDSKGYLNDTATAITSVDLYGNAAACFAVGCKIRAWAIRF